MNDDLIGKVADELRAGLADFGITGDEESDEALLLDLARAAITTHTEYLFAQSEVSEDDLLIATGWTDPDVELDAVRALLTRAILQATDEWVSLWKQAANSLMSLQEDLVSAQETLSSVESVLTEWGALHYDAYEVTISFHDGGPENAFDLIAAWALDQFGGGAHVHAAPTVPDVPIAKVRAALTREEA